MVMLLNFVSTQVHASADAVLYFALYVYDTGSLLLLF